MYVYHTNVSNGQYFFKGVRCTIVGIYEGGVLTMTVSRCSKNDNFSRTKGRSNAIDRLNAGLIQAEFHLPQCTQKDFNFLAAKLEAFYVINPNYLPKISTN
jgi:hypothetical protein